MKSEVVEVATCRYKVSVEVPAQEVDAQFDQAFNSIRGRVEIKGFRRGHAPRSIIMKRYGEDIAHDVTGRLFQESFLGALKEKGLSSLGEPEMDFESLAAKAGQVFSYTAEIDVRPTITLPAYKGIALTETVEAVSDAQVVERLDGLVKSFATYNETAEGFKKGDAVIADLVMQAQGNTIMSREDFRLPPEVDRLMGIEVKDLQDTLAGLKAGESRNYTVDVPAGYYQQDAAGKTVVITVTAKKIETPSFPAIDDELAKRVGFDSLEGLKNRIKENMEAERKQASRGELGQKLVEQLLSQVSFDLPKDYIDRQVKSRVTRQKEFIEKSTEGDEEKAKKIAELEESMRAEAEKMTRRMIVIEAIAEAEKVEVTQDDMWRHIQQMAGMYGIKPDQMVKQLQQMDAMMYVVQEVRDIKTVDYLLGQAQITTTQA